MATWAVELVEEIDLEYGHAEVAVRRAAQSRRPHGRSRAALASGSHRSCTGCRRKIGTHARNCQRSFSSFELSTPRTTQKILPGREPVRPARKVDQRAVDAARGPEGLADRMRPSGTSEAGGRST